MGKLNTNELSDLIKNKIVEGLRNIDTDINFDVLVYFSSWDNNAGRRLQIYVNIDGKIEFDLPLTIYHEQFIDDHITLLDAALYLCSSDKYESIFRTVFTPGFYNTLKDILRQFPGYE
jgi:hypothetical protein